MPGTKSRLESTLAKIDGSLGRINTHPEYSRIVEREVVAAIRNDAVKHSLGLEVNHEHGKLSRKVARKEHERTLGNLECSWAYLGIQGVTLGSLAQLGHYINPEGHPLKNFRASMVKFGEFVPPVPDRIPFEVRNLVDFLDAGEHHPVIRAAEAHLELVRIHPYEDGNGRAARLVQNSLLQQRGLPCAVIKVAEKDLYLDIINGALRSRYAGQSSVLAPGDTDLEFQLFIATKVLDATTQLEEQLQTRRMYMIHVEGVRDKEAIYAAAKQLRRCSDCEHAPVTVHLHDGKRPSSKTLQVTGDVSTHELASHFGRLARKYGFSYRVQSLTD